MAQYSRGPLSKALCRFADPMNQEGAPVSQNTKVASEGLLKLSTKKTAYIIF